MHRQGMSSVVGSERGAEMMIPFVEPIDAGMVAEVLADRQVYLYANASTCPDCGGAMMRLGGCCACPSCGYQSCSV